MSGEIVLAPVAGAVGAVAGVSALVAAAPLLIGYGALAGAVRLGVSAMSALEEADRQRRERMRQETEALGREIARLARTAAKKQPPVLSGEFLAKNRRALESALDSLDFKKTAFNIEDYQIPPPESDEPDTSGACRELFAALALVSGPAASACEKLLINIEKAASVRQKAVLDNLRIEYGNAVRGKAASFWRKRKIREAFEALSGEAAVAFGKELDAAGYPDEALTEETFEKLQNAYARIIEKDCLQKRNEIVEASLLGNMKKLGYSPVGKIRPDAPIFFHSGERDYRIMARVNPQNGQLSLRFVRVVASEREKGSLTTAQRRKDVEQEQKWCAKATRLLSALSADTGISFSELYRKEPDEKAAVMVVVDASLAERREEGGKHAGI